MKNPLLFLTGICKIVILLMVMALLLNGLFLKSFLAASLGLYWDTDIEIEHARIDWALPGIVLDDVDVGNPYGFPRERMLEISNITIRFGKNRAFFKAGVLQPEFMDILIPRIELMRRVSGHLNLQLFAFPPEGVKKRGLRIVPAQTRFWVGEVYETDASTPLLMRKQYPLAEEQFVYREKKDFKEIAQAFTGDLLKRLAIGENQTQTLIPAPQYHGVAATLEQEVRASAEAKTKEAASEKQNSAVT